MEDNNKQEYRPIDGEVTTLSLTKGVSKTGSVFANASIAIYGYGILTIPCPVKDTEFDTPMQINAQVLNVEDFAKLEMKKTFDKLYVYDGEINGFVETKDPKAADRRRVLMHPDGKAFIVENIDEVMKTCINVGKIRRKDGSTVDAWRLKAPIRIRLAARPGTYHIAEDTPAFEV